MASVSYPSPAYNGGSVTDLEFERLSAPQAPDGLIGVPSDLPLAFADSTGTRVVKVRANRRGLVRGFAYDSGATDIPLTCAANTSGATRIDLIVLRLDRTTWTVKEAVVQGTPGSGAPAAVQNTGAIGVWDLPIASVSVVNGASTLAAGTVTPLAWYVGDDGQILCTPTTRPPHSNGRRIRETTTGRTYESNGTTWVTLYDNSGTLSAQLFPGYTATQNSIRRLNGVVVFALTVRKNVTIAAGTDSFIGTVPTGFTPDFTVDGLALYWSASGQAVGLRVTSAGGIYIATPAGMGINADRDVVGQLTWFV